MNTETTTPLIYAAMSTVMAKVDPIAKSRKNTGQGYSFRGIDDIYQALQAILAGEGIFTTSEIMSERTEDRQTAKGSALIYRVLHIRWRFYAPDGSFVTHDTIGEGMDSGDKAANKAMSAAHKYAFLTVFCIPTEEPKDSENDSHELKAKSPEPVREQKIFNANDPKATQWLESHLKTKGVSGDSYQYIAGALHGKDIYTELAKIIASVLESEQ